MDINKLARKIHANNKKKGFWDKKRNEGEVLMLVITELAELVESDRKGRICKPHVLEYMEPYNNTKEAKINFFTENIKDTTGDELADAFIRMCDYCAGFKIEINDTFINYTVDGFLKLKLKNLGEELLNICGLIRQLSLDKNKEDKEMSSMFVFARLMWIAIELNIPLEKHIEYKIWYNSTRSKMHGKKY